MKTSLVQTFVLLLVILFSSQARAEEQNRKVDPFTSISLRIEANVHLEQGDKPNLEIVAKSSTLEQLITEVKEGELIIRFPNKNYFWNDFNPGEITIYATTTEINKLAVSGSGDIVADGEIKTNKLELSVSGSGNIKLEDLSAQQVKTFISGSGNIHLAGKNPAEDLSATISGSGNLKAIDFNADDVNVKISGSGSVGIQANKNLNARVSGSGNVNYKGNPMIDSAVSGSGKVRKIE
jgi:hypothetical protein